MAERRAKLPLKGANPLKQLHDSVEAQALALAIVDTLPEPFLVLDDTLLLLAGSRCFYELFGEDPKTAHGRSLFELSGAQWDIPGLRQLLSAVVDERTTIDSFEFERVFAKLGKRTLQLNALPIRDESGAGRMVLVAIKDIRTPRRRTRKAAASGAHRRTARTAKNLAPGDASPDRKQPANHCQHPAAQGWRGDFGRDQE